MLKEYSFGNIYIRHAIDDFPNDKDFTMHVHDRCEIYFFISGMVEYLVEGSRYSLSSSEMCIITVVPRLSLPEEEISYSPPSSQLQCTASAPV